MAMSQTVAELVPYITASTPSLDKAHYRSKLFSLHDSRSPIVAAANPVFSLLDRFACAKHLPALEKVMANLEHELKAFQSALLSQGNTESEQLLAYYLLAVTVDEVLGRSYLRVYGKAPMFKAFTPPTYANQTAEFDFFTVLAALKAKPDEGLPLLELAYYCLLAGYEGRYHGQADGRQCLETHIDSIYRLILPYRQQRAYTLFEKALPPEPVKQPYLRLGLMGGGLVLLFVLAFYSSHWVLEHQANRLRFMPAFITTLDE